MCPLVSTLFSWQCKNVHTSGGQHCMNLAHYWNQSSYLNTSKYCGTIINFGWERSVTGGQFSQTTSFSAGYPISQRSRSSCWRSPACDGGWLIRWHCQCWNSLSLSCQLLGYKRRYPSTYSTSTLNTTIMFWSVVLKVKRKTAQGVERQAFPCSFF